MQEYIFEEVPTLLVVGNECRGIVDEIIIHLDEIIEIEQFGLPHSLNVAVATSIFLFEYSKQIKGNDHENSINKRSIPQECF